MPGGEQDMQSQSTFDDDRLVAYVLGLADDPELRAAAAEDGALQKHLARIGAELEQVHEQLDLAVPTPDPTWADLSSERWQKLQPYVRTHQRTSRRRFGWRLLAPALTAAAAVALASVIPPGTLPFVVTGQRILTSVVLMVVAAMVGCAFSLRRVLRIDPAAAIGTAS